MVKYQGRCLMVLQIFWPTLLKLDRLARSIGSIANLDISSERGVRSIDLWTGRNRLNWFFFLFYDFRYHFWLKTIYVLQLKKQYSLEPILYLCIYFIFCIIVWLNWTKLIVLFGKLVPLLIKKIFKYVSEKEVV